MGDPVCDLLEAELALDRIEAALATELPAHVRSFAAAYAAGTPTPPAPIAPASLAGARRALVHPFLADRALALVRLLAPIAIESDARVTAARAAEPSWDGYAELRAARDAAARARFGIDHVDLVHRLHGSRSAANAGWPEPIAGWNEPCEPIGGPMIERVWRDLATRHDARGICRITRAPVRPRAFVVEPGHEVIVVIGAIDTPAARFTALHELGHAIAALVVTGTLPRVVDEAAAAYIARSLEREGDLDLVWFTPLAAHARERRCRLAAALDAVERGGAPTTTMTRPPWALWHDPGAQATYVAAEAIADRWWAEPPDSFGDALATERAQIDRATTLPE